MYLTLALNTRRSFILNELRLCSPFANPSTYSIRHKGLRFKLNSKLEQYQMYVFHDTPIKHEDTGLILVGTSLFKIFHCLSADAPADAPYTYSTPEEYY